MILAMCDFSRILVYPKENPQSKIPWPVKAPCLTQLPDARQGLFDEGSLFEKPSENYRGKPYWQAGALLSAAGAICCIEQKCKNAK